MSSIYVSEPPTKGKVVLNTTYGPLDVELWPKEAPKAARNFVQLCIEGYYDNTIFHRVIKSFLVQGGDPTGTGTGGGSIYGGVFADEFHSRLRFNHRGLLACANAGSPHSNGSQFFMSLDRCDWLDRKNTIFGKVTGDSIFNLLRLGEVDTDKNDRPLNPPPRIISIEVLWNPFDDIIPRKAPEKSLSYSTADTEGKDQKRKAVKKLNLLSFGEEAEEEEKELAAVKEKIKSSHDVLNDPRLLKEAPKEELNALEVQRKKDLQISVREALASKRDNTERQSDINLSDGNDLSDDDEAKFDARMRLQILRKRKDLGEITSRQKMTDDEYSPKEHGMASPRSNGEDLERRGSKKEKLSLKKKGIGSEARAEHLAKADADLQLLGDDERHRQMQKQKKRRLQGREEDTLAKLERFRKSVALKPIIPVSNESRGDDEADESGWTAHQLKFMPDPSNKDGMARKDDPNEYVVHDPLLEKGKEKFNKMQAKLKRREREWAGQSIT
ncbi:peptidyl-prolyl cis-trans isomerase CYP57 [Magnolia sinica]|uniref:peptidyl-prolyl cis-trans isomerase CYP57 n=1 Tax=Magnolia sinica TaxID=86752 RepID=UPI0026596A37|nr:peptidyl-prolyl cis-trans isomerase CYP57 [Magnolia sinica]